MLRPHSPEVFTATLAEAKRLHLAGEFKRARILYQDLADRHPEETGPRLMLAELDMRDGRLLTARRQLEVLVRRHPEVQEIRLALAGVAEELADMDTAIPIYRRDALADPENGVLQLRLASVLRIAGRIDEAKQIFRHMTEKWPDSSAGYTGLAAIDPALISDADIDAMQAICQATSIVQEQVQILFALGEIFDRRQAHEAAFQSFDKANRLRRQILGEPIGDIAAQKVLPKAAVVRTTIEEAEAVQVQFVEQAREMFSPQYLSYFGGGGHASDAPIFIVGMPRSGSTLLEQILSSHPNVTGLGETSALGASFRRLMPAPGVKPTEEFKRAFYREVGESYLDALKELGWSGHDRTIDKMLGNYVNVGIIHLAFPRAIIINSVRDPVDTCFSCFRHLFKDRNETTYDLSAVGRQYVLYRSLVAYWDQVLPGRILHVRHEELLADPETQVRQLIAACRLEWDDACLRFYETDRPVRTASSAQVRRPLFKSGMARWKPYEKHLEPLFRALGPYAPEDWRDKIRHS